LNLLLRKQSCFEKRIKPGIHKENDFPAGGDAWWCQGSARSTVSAPAARQVTEIKLHFTKFKHF
jgi:hypothetical protein